MEMSLRFWLALSYAALPCASAPWSLQKWAAAVPIAQSSSAIYCATQLALWRDRWKSL